MLGENGVKVNDKKAVWWFNKFFEMYKEEKLDIDEIGEEKIGQII